MAKEPRVTLATVVAGESMGQRWHNKVSGHRLPHLERKYRLEKGESKKAEPPCCIMPFVYCTSPVSDTAVQAGYSSRQQHKVADETDSQSLCYCSKF